MTSGLKASRKVAFYRQSFNGNNPRNTILNWQPIPTENGPWPFPIRFRPTELVITSKLLMIIEKLDLSATHYYSTFRLRWVFSTLRNLTITCTVQSTLGHNGSGGKQKLVIWEWFSARRIKVPVKKQPKPLLFLVYCSESLETIRDSTKLFPQKSHYIFRSPTCPEHWA